MLFSSMIFLQIFLPLMVFGAWVLRKSAVNVFLLAGSLLFYGWGEPRYIILLLISIVLNYLTGLWVGMARAALLRKAGVLVSLLGNLALLGHYKYANFFVDNINHVFPGCIGDIGRIALPIGISFYTFQALSYVIDVYRREVEPERNILNLALYVSFFPQLVAGPIVKFHDVALQLQDRTVTLARVAYGIRRFIYGLGKKVLLANTAAKLADDIFALGGNMDTSLAWVGIAAYSLQIYFDFSGYSDMAIGLGKMFGFDYLENFNYPYVSRSIKEFWRRWHISLSTWFKEYLYIPLGGNRVGSVRTYVNLAIVFFATGIWHGASWNFVVWGLFHGFFIIVERMTEKWCCRFKSSFAGMFLGHIYALLAVMVGWVFFRAETLTQAAAYLKVMFTPTSSPMVYEWSDFISPMTMVMMMAALVLCGPLQLFPRLRKMLYREDKIYWIEVPILGLLLFVSAVFLGAGTYNPFIYFRF